jgi:branched-chain amino acid transport system ATP-binding protein
MVTGYLKPSAGTIRFRGRDITGLAPRHVVRAGVCRSFQVSQLFRELTVLDNMLIAFGMLRADRLSWLTPLATPERERDARAVLARYTIEQYAPSPIVTLPQGVRKLLDIAMATVSDPALLLLDEPTSGVAVEEKFPLMDTVMTQVAASGAASLFVEHDMEIVERYASRVIAFYDGRILADGPVAQVLADAEVRRYVIGTEIHRTKQ